MYVPNAFRISDLTSVLNFIQTFNFATIITTEASNGSPIPFASHLPLVVSSMQEPIRLVGHMARANPQWKHFLTGQEFLMIFHGPHSYISPTWYRSEVAVPTWNYAVVHAYGTAQILVDEEEARAVQHRLVARHEGVGEGGWDPNKFDAYVRSLLLAIVSFDITVTRFEAKFKLSQNRSLADQEAAAEKLLASDREQARATGALMMEHSGRND